MAATPTDVSFRDRYGPWAVVAGGSDGIGAAFARDLACRGMDLCLLARREAPLAALASELADRHAIQTRTLSLDLTAEDVDRRVGDATSELDVGLFVYNAGSNPTTNEFTKHTRQEILFLLDRNARGPLLLSHHFGRRFAERGRGGLILMSSLACLSGSHWQSVYAATKAFDTILAEGLWHELAPAGVDVLGVLAGKTRTETMQHAGEKFADGMDPADVAAGALDHLGHGPVFVPGEANQATARAIWPVPRVGLINAMSRASADLFDLDHPDVPGREFDQG